MAAEFSLIGPTSSVVLYSIRAHGSHRDEFRIVVSLRGQNSEDEFRLERARRIEQLSFIF